MITRKHKIYKVGTISYPAEYWGEKIVPFLNGIADIVGFKLKDDEFKKVIEVYGKNHEIKSITDFINIYTKYTKYSLVSLSKQRDGNVTYYTLTLCKYV